MSAEKADSVRHMTWHFIVPQSVGKGWGWCIDCQRTVPVPAKNDGSVQP